MELPRQLAPWNDYLDIFPRELALALGPLIQRLDLLIGTIKTNTHRNQGEPDGFDGIARRGTYERLLLSEWLLAEEVPEEFSRRAAMGEHAFLQLAHREPAGTRVSVALFDGGPNQWGTPRIAQLAALIVLARRAHTIGAQFSWGILQASEVQLFSEVNVASVAQLLKIHSPQEATENDLVSWRQRLSAEGSDDFWVIGGHALSDWRTRNDISLLLLQDVYEPGVHQLLARIAMNARNRNDVILELPEDSVCAQLLRDPFKKAVPQPTHATGATKATTNLLFAFGGSKMLARSKKKGILSYSIPNSSRAPSAKPKLFQSVFGNTIIAAGRIAKSTVAISILDTKAAFRLEHIGARNNPIESGEYAWEGGAPDTQLTLPKEELLPCIGFPRNPVSQTRVWVLTPNGTLFCLHKKGDGSRVATLRASRVEAITLLPSNRLAYVAWRDKKSLIASFDETPLNGKRLLVSLDEREVEITQAVDPGGLGAFFGFGGSLGHEWMGLLAVEKENNYWSVYLKEEAQTLVCPRGMSVVGVAVAQLNTSVVQPVLVVLSGDRRVLTLLGSTSSRVLPRAPSPIIYAAASSYGSLINYSTEQGDVYVYSIDTGEILYRLIAEAES